MHMDSVCEQIKMATAVASKSLYKYPPITIKTAGQKLD